MANTNELIMVDDNKLEIDLAHRCYKKSKVRNPWLAFTDGDDLIKYLEDVQSGLKSMPALILLDINMPGVNGFDVLQSIRQNPNFSRLPIVLMFTNSDSPRDREKADNAGADGYFIKPDSISGYIDFFNSLL